ncbi:MAG: hypothetical protein AB1816_16985 [Bacillota bacterium]
MQSYPVPYLPRGEERLVGGRLSVRQFLYLLAGGGLALVLLRAGAGAGAVLPAAVCAAFAFGELPHLGMRLDEFLVCLVRYECGRKAFPNRGKAG